MQMVLKRTLGGINIDIYLYERNVDVKIVKCFTSDIRFLSELVFCSGTTSLSSDKFHYPVYALSFFAAFS